MELRQKTNKELFTLYEGELAFHHRSVRGLHEAKRILKHFHDYLGEFPPTPELAKSFLSKFTIRKTTTIARYAAILKMFFKWYGEELDIKLRVPKILPSYVEKSDIDKLLDAIKNKRSHKDSTDRDLALVDLAIHTGLRRSELANLTVGDIDIIRQLLAVRQGKGSKDRVIPLSGKMCSKLDAYIKGKEKSENLFALTPATISGKIRTFARKAGVKIHTHSLRDYFATSLSEKGATIREIQSLLGHANLTHTERYTLHTDKHLRKAVELMDDGDSDDLSDKNIKQQFSTDNKSMKLENKEIIDQFSDTNINIPHDKTNEPFLLIRAVDKPDEIDQTKVMIGGYFSHFEIWNEGKTSASEVTISLMNKDKRDWFEQKQVDTIRPNETVDFQPILSARPEGNYFILCQYQSVTTEVNNEHWNQIWLPFRFSYSSRQKEIYVNAYKIEILFDVEHGKKINIW